VPQRAARAAEVQSAWEKLCYEQRQNERVAAGTGRNRRTRVAGWGGNDFIAESRRTSSVPSSRCRRGSAGCAAVQVEEEGAEYTLVLVGCSG
jgi:hypothetical protein